MPAHDPIPAPSIGRPRARCRRVTREVVANAVVRSLVRPLVPFLCQLGDDVFFVAAVDMATVWLVALDRARVTDPNDLPSPRRVVPVPMTPDQDPVPRADVDTGPIDARTIRELCARTAQSNVHDESQS